MCKCCQHCLESCYWHLIEKRFCFDESIALYKDPVEKQEKNNNMFENMAFYDSVAVIAGRAIVTIDPLPQNDPVVQQPRRLRWQEQVKNHTRDGNSSRTVLPIVIEKSSDESTASNDSEKHMIDEEDKVIDKRASLKKSVSFEDVLSNKFAKQDKETAESSTEESSTGENITEETSTRSNNTLAKPDVESRKKSLRERRMSKSLYLKIDFPKEVPIIRQNSMPKFFLDTPQENQSESTLVKSPLTSLKSPMVNTTEFSYDLYSVVQMEKSKSQNVPKEVVQIHRSPSRLSQIKEKIKLRKSKSTISASNIPHSNYI